MKNYTFFKTTILALLLSFAFGCNKDDGVGSITLQLDHSVKDTPLEIEQLKYTCEAGHTFSVVNLKYYLSRIVLHEDDGTSFSIVDVHLCDIHDPSSLQYMVEDIPDGDYTSISFIFGLDEAMNVDGGLENTVENINMEWPIPGDQGYHYMKFEGRYDSLDTGTIRSFNVHIGATMGNQNYFEVTLPFSEVAVRSNSWLINIGMDLNEWLQNPNTFDFAGMEMIMMNQAAQELLKANGANIFGINSVRKN